VSPTFPWIDPLVTALIAAAVAFTIVIVRPGSAPRRLGT